MRTKLFKAVTRKLSICCLLVLGLASCKEEFSKVLPDTGEDDAENVVFGQPKVLLLVVDGARGESVKQANIPNINKLIPQSILSWNSLSEENAKGITANWTDILTGVSYKKHGVIDNDFSSNKLESYPLVFDRILNHQATSKLKLVSPDAAFVANYGKTSQGEQVSNDQEVTSKLIASLQDDQDITMLTGHFTNINTQGQSAGYDNSFPAYKAAIESFDTQVGEILKALSDRSSYAEENWLVIITSSQGGKFEIPPAQNDNTVFSVPDLNTFTLMYSPKYTEKFIGKPYLGNKLVGDFMRFNETKYARLDSGDNSIYNFGLSDFTIEFKIKKNKGSNNNYQFSYPSLIGKRPTWQSGWDREEANGWVVHLSGNSWIFNARGETGFGEIKANTALNNATWNTITVVRTLVDNVRKIRLYTNGNLSTESDITGWGSLDSDSKFTIGYLSNKDNWRSDAYISDVKAWKVALPTEVVKEYGCEIGISPNHPYFDYLAGYWPIFSAEGDMLIDEGPFGSHLKLGEANYTFTTLNDFICAPSVAELGSQVPRTIDISAQIISWLKVPRQLNWQLDGRVWLDK